MLARDRRTRAQSGKPDYAEIRRLEIALGFEDPPHNEVTDADRAVVRGLLAHKRGGPISYHARSSRFRPVLKDAASPRHSSERDM